MKLPNGYGSVYKLSGKRRKPYAVVVTKGWDDNGKQIKELIGTASSKSEAFEMLNEYNNTPYDIKLSKITFEELFNLWLPWKNKTAKISKKSITRYNNAFKYYKNYHKDKFIDISFLILQTIIDDCPHGYHTKSDIKLLYSQLYTYAKQIDVPVKKDASDAVYLGDKEKSTLHTPFTDEEIEILWEHKDNDIIKLILIDIYTGFRPTELLYPKEINLDVGYIISGIKTEAGIDRKVPINDKIRDLVKDVLVNIKMSYSTYNFNFKEVMKELNLNHKPYDCRHTFATMLDNVKANDVCIKILMGHSINDITKGVYTHKTFEQLKEEINKI